MDVVQIKSYLFPENSKVTLAALQHVDEIRRFNLSLKDTTGLYKSMIEKIQQAYGDLLPNQAEIKTYWQDDECELIGFSSDNELQYAIDVLAALNLSKPYAKTLLFKVYIAKKSEKTKSEKKDHQKGVHLGVVCDACDGPVIGSRYKCTVCPDYDLCEECNNKNLHKEHSLNKIQRPNHPFGMFGQGRGPRCNRRQNTNSNSQNPFASFSNMFNPAMFEQMQNLAAHNVPLVNNPEHLKQFGEQLKKVLDPFGIDVSYYVDSMTKDENKPKEKDAKKETKRNEKPKTAEKEDKDKAETSDHQKSDSLMDESITEPSVNEQSVLIESESVFTQKETKKIDVEKDETPKATAPEENSLIDLQKSVEPFAKAIESLRKVAGENYENVEKTPERDSIEEFNLVDIEKEIKIINSIETLKNMGYSDDGGWLTRLVSAKNGNINAVLDAISPAVPRQ